MWRRVGLVTADISVERVEFIFRMEIFRQLGTILAVTIKLLAVTVKHLAVTIKLLAVTIKLISQLLLTIFLARGFLPP
jgi:hypothetical protein